MKLLFPFFFSFVFFVNINAQQIAVNKDSLEIAAADTLLIYNIGTDTLKIDSLYTVKKQFGYKILIQLPDSSFFFYLYDSNYKVPSIPPSILHFNILPGDTAKFIFEYVDICPYCVYKNLDYTPNFKDTLIFLSNSIVNDSLAIYAEGHGLDFVENEEVIAKYFKLYQNYPNPFNPTTKISYLLKQPGEVKLIIYDLAGKEVKILVNKFQNSGAYSVDFKAENLPSGVYFYRLELNSLILTKKMILLR